MNITVRVDGIITITRTEEQFVNMMANVYGFGYTLDEYIDMYNTADGANRSDVNFSVHKEVPTDAAELKAKMVNDAVEQQDLLDAATDHLSDVVGKEVTIEFAEEED